MSKVLTIVRATVCALPATVLVPIALVFVTMIAKATDTFDYQIGFPKAPSEAASAWSALGDRTKIVADSMGCGQELDFLLKVLHNPSDALEQIIGKMLWLSRDEGTCQSAPYQYHQTDLPTDKADQQKYWTDLTNASDADLNNQYAMTFDSKVCPGKFLSPGKVLSLVSGLSENSPAGYVTPSLPGQSGVRHRRNKRSAFANASDRQGGEFGLAMTTDPFPKLLRYAPVPRLLLQRHERGYANTVPKNS